MPSLRDWLCTIAGEAIRDLPDLNPWQFAEENVFLDGHASLKPRFYDSSLTPYTRIMQEAATGQWSKIHADDWWLRALVENGERVNEFFCVKSSQSGFTQAALNIIAFVARHLSGRGLYCIDSKDKAGKLCRMRLIPLLKRICATELRDNDDGLGTHKIELQNFLLELVGSYSAGVFSEKALNWAFLDDVAYFVTEGGKRGMLDGVHIIDHTRSRFTTAEDPFLAVFSKPDVEEDQFILEAKGGSQHELYTPCPYCNRPFVMKLRHLHWEDEACRDVAGRWDLAAVEQLGGAKCPHHGCGKHIEEAWKGPMVEAAYYVPKSRELRAQDRDPLMVPRRMSVNVNDMVSPFITWGKLCVMKIGTQDNPAKLRYFLSNHGAEPWREKSINLKAEHVKALIAGTKHPVYGTHGEADGVPAYRRGQCPFVPDIVAATSDKQGDKLKWTLWGYRLQADKLLCALIEYGASLDENDLLALSDDPKAHDGGPIVCPVDRSLALFAGYGVEGGAGNFIDSGFETHDVYDFTISSGFRWFPTKGVSGLYATGSIVAPKETEHSGEKFLRFHYDDYAVKTGLYKGKIALHSHPDPKVRRASTVYLPKDVGEDFIVELISESLQPGPGGKMVWVHDKTIGPNDWGDASKKGVIVVPQILGEVIRENAAARIEEPQAQVV